ncbi:MAG: PAS domain S-box protein, partial [Pseudanabaena sp.]
QNLNANRQNLEHKHQVIANLQSITGELVDAELGERGQIITKDPIFVIDIYSKIQRLRDRLKNLHQKLQDDPIQKKHFAIVEPLVNQRIEILEKSLQLWQQNSQNTTDRIELTYQARQLRLELDARFAEMKVVEDHQLILQSQSVGDNVQTTLVFVILGAVTSFSLFVINYLLLIQEVSIRKQAEMQFQQNNQDLEQKVQERTDDLQTREELWRNAIFNAPLPITLHIENDEFLLVNQAWTNLSGYAIVDIPTVHDWTRQVYGERHLEVDALLQKFYAGSEHFNSDIAEVDTAQIITKQGKTLFWDYYSAPLNIQPNGKRLWISMALNVTDRKLAEDALRASQRQYETLAEVVPVGIFRADLQGNSIYVNHRSCEIMGISFAEAMGKGWANSIHPEDRDRVFRHWHDAVTNHQKFYAEYRFLHPDGEMIWVIAQVVPEIENDIILGYVGTITDINLLKSVEKELQEAKSDLEARVAERTTELLNRQIQLESSNRRWQSLLDNLRLLVIGLNDQGNIEYVNPFFLSLTGYQLNEIIGQDVFSLLLLEHESQENRVAFTEILTSGDCPPCQNQILTKAGEQLSITWNNTPLRDLTGNISGI